MRVRLMLTFLVVFGCLWIIGCRVIDTMMYPSPPCGYEMEDPYFFLTTSGGKKVAARHFPKEGSHFVLLVSHGNGEDLGTADPWCRRLQEETGAEILAYDYRGYGQSSGKPSEKGTYLDIEAAWNHLLELGREPSEIIIYGRSIGSGPSVELAAKKKEAALILESPFTSAFAVMGAAWVPGDRYENLAKIDQIESPILFLHGEEDRLISPAHSARLLEKAKPPKTRHVFPGAGHNDLAYVGGEAYWSRIREFLEHCSNQ